jgi:hypothetical protein
MALNDFSGMLAIRVPSEEGVEATPSRARRRLDEVGWAKRQDNPSHMGAIPTVAIALPRQQDSI